MEGQEGAVLWAARWAGRAAFGDHAPAVWYTFLVVMSLTTLLLVCVLVTYAWHLVLWLTFPVRFVLQPSGDQAEALASFYRTIAASEARHDEAFTGLAYRYFDRQEVDARLDCLLDEEAEIVRRLEIRAALH